MDNNNNKMSTRPAGWRYLLWIRVVIVAIGVMVNLQTTDGMEGHSSEYCQWESFNASCSTDEIVLMDTARYGRMRVGRCVKQTYGKIGCQEDILYYADERCSGRASCRMPVPDISVSGIKPCPGDLTSYFEVTYSCIKVVTGNFRECRKHGYMTLPPSGGYIASQIANDYGQGSVCPWRIHAPHGQRVNLTLYDFSSRVSKEESQSGGVQRTFCRKYALVKEEGKGHGTPICGGLERVRNVYISEGSTLDIQILNSRIPNEEVYFAIKYESIGCTRLPERKDAQVEQTDTTAQISCHITEQKWHLRCHGNKWVGAVGNCSSGDGDIWSVLTEDWSSPKGLLIVIGLGVALGTVIGVVLLVLVLLWFRRKSTLSERPTEKKPYSDSPQDALRRNYASSGVTSELSYSTGSTATTWAPQRPLPTPYIEEDVAKRPSREYQGMDTLTNRGGDNTLTMPVSKARGSHVYESPKFNRREFNPSECDFETGPPMMHVLQ